LQPVVGDHPFDASCTDGEAGLAEFLGDDVGGRIRIKKAVANNLPYDFVRASVIPFWTARLARQRLGSLLLVGLAKLEVALFAEPVFLGRSVGAEAFAFSFNQHGQLPSNLVFLANPQGTMIAHDGLHPMIKVHRDTSCW